MSEFIFVIYGHKFTITQYIAIADHGCGKLSLYIDTASGLVRKDMLGQDY